MILSLVSSLAPVIFITFFAVLLVVAFLMAGKKMKKLNEESKKRERDFFAANTELLLAQMRNNKAENDKTQEDIATVKFEADEKIVVLDGYVLNPGDLSWDAFNAFGEVTVYDRTPEELVVERIRDATVVITNKTIFTKEMMDKCPTLKYIGVIATGYNVVDVAAAGEKGIVVTNVPGYGTDAVAQFTFALMLELCNQVGLHSDSVMSGEWSKRPDFSYWLNPLTDISGKTLGIIGYGSIGSKVAEIALAFGMKVLVNSRTKKYTGGRIKWVELEELLAEADIVTLHCPLTGDNEKLINEETIAKMKDGARLINTARGGLVDEQALVAALNSGKLSGAALDVISEEPMSKDSPLPGTRNLIVTPHIAWASHEARERLMNIAADNVRKFLSGEPQNVVS